MVPDQLHPSRKSLSTTAGSGLQRSFSLTELLANVHGVETQRLAFNNDKIWLGMENPRNLGTASTKLKMLHRKVTYCGHCFFCKLHRFLEPFDMDYMATRYMLAGRPEQGHPSLGVGGVDEGKDARSRHHHICGSCVSAAASMEGGIDARFCKAAHGAGRELGDAGVAWQDHVRGICIAIQLQDPCCPCFRRTRMALMRS
ncbi:hypothetical protein ACP70R_023233 [Stipagrostis hirtigluma subsp. patula]